MPPTTFMTAEKANTAIEFNLQCPVPPGSHDRVVMGHGGGGRLTQRLIETVFLPAFANAPLEARHDGAVLDVAGRKLAFTTDSYVVRPLFFPGGSIGDLAVNGTVNDLAMCGARPLFLSCGFILEEGVEMDVVRRVAGDMSEAARRANVLLVTGDTKVVDRGKGDGVYVNTSGIGILEGPAMSPAGVQPGDAILISGALGMHGVAILSVREGLEFEAPVVSDTAPLWDSVAALISGGIDVHCLRDLTRGGLASALNEIAEARGAAMEVDEAAVPVPEVVRGACELLGLDPLYVANEGRFAAFVPGAQAEKALAILRSVPVSSEAVAVGVVSPETKPAVWLRSRSGGRRSLDMLSGEQLPRIC